MVAGCHHAPLQNDDYYFCNLSKALDSLNSYYEKFLLIGHFNSEDHEFEISSLLNNHEAKNIVKEKHVSKLFWIPHVLIFLLQTALKAFNTHVVFLLGFLIITV